MNFIGLWLMQCLQAATPGKDTLGVLYQIKVALERSAADKLGHLQNLVSVLTPAMFCCRTQESL